MQNPPSLALKRQSRACNNLSPDRREAEAPPSLRFALYQLSPVAEVTEKPVLHEDVLQQLKELAEANTEVHLN